MNFKSLPKIELHLHLDCSLSYEVVRKLKPEISRSDYQSSFIAPAKCTDLADYITRAIIAIDLMQTPEQLRLVTHDLMEQLKADNVIYAEIRFAPLQHLEQGLEPEEVMQTVCDALNEASEVTGVKAGLIICTLRHYSEEQSMQTVHLAEQFMGKGAVGFDLAADEAGFPIDNHIAAFKYAKVKGIPSTAHAGEAKGPESVRETLLHFSNKRIGHGVRSIEDVNMINQLVEDKILLEVCPTSNIQTAIFENYPQHSINELYNKGVAICINTDGRTISNTTLNQEYAHLHQAFGWGMEHFKQCNLNAINYAFTDDEVKESLRVTIIEQMIN